MDNFYLVSGGSAVLFSMVMQMVKNSEQFPWLSRQTGKLNLLVSIVAAGITAVGISYTFDFDRETGKFVLGFSGTVSDLLHGIGHWTGQFLTQHSFYKTFVVPAEALGEIRSLLNAAVNALPTPNVEAKAPPSGAEPNPIQP